MLGCAMARLIKTGEMEAIDLKYIHSSEILYLDQKVSQVQTEGGFGKILLEIKHGLIHLAECTTSQIFNRKR